MGSFANLARRVVVGAVGAQVTFNSAFLALGYLCEDQSFLEHWSYATPVRVRPAGFFSFTSNALRTDEAECLEHWLTLLNQGSIASWDRFSPSLITLHTLFMYDGRRELQTAFEYFQQLSSRIAVSVLPIEVRREYQDKVVYLHMKSETTLTVRLPFSTVERTFGPLVSVSSLQLERQDDVRESTKGGALHITGIEERWFGGTLWSLKSNSVNSPWGDIGDLVRRLNGYTVVSLPQALCEAKRSVWPSLATTQ